MSLAGLIPAAGRASRMGRDKRLLSLGGHTLLELAVKALAEAGLSPVVVVTGPEPQPVLPAGVLHVINPDPGRGMASSIVVGLRALLEAVDGVAVLPADMPKVTAEHVRKLVEAFRPESICVPTFEDRRGNPVLLSRRFFAEMADLTGDKGARGLIARHEDAVIRVPMPDDGVLTDVDTPEAWRAVEGT